MNSSRDIFDARSNDGAAMVEKTKSECDLGGFECDRFPMRFWVALMRIFYSRKSVECLTEKSTAL